MQLALHILLLIKNILHNCLFLYLSFMDICMQILLALMLAMDIIIYLLLLIESKVRENLDFLSTQLESIEIIIQMLLHYFYNTLK
jgi:hypothetical protein